MSDQGVLPDCSRIAPGTIRAAQVKSGAESDRKRNGKASKLPQKCISVAAYHDPSTSSPENHIVQEIKACSCTFISELP